MAYQKERILRQIRTRLSILEGELPYCSSRKTIDLILLEQKALKEVYQALAFDSHNSSWTIDKKTQRLIKKCLQEGRERTTDLIKEALTEAEEEKQKSIAMEKYDLMKKMEDVKKEEEKGTKVMLMGDGAVGKSCLLLRATDDTYTETFISTIGIDFKNFSNQGVKGRIYDTQGGNGIAQSKYIRPHAIAVCFDVTDKVTFENAKKWIKEIKLYSSDSVKIILVANKCDDEDHRVIHSDVAQELASEFELSFYAETSAKDNINCKELFVHISHVVTSNAQPGDTPNLLYQQGHLIKRAVSLHEPQNEKSLRLIENRDEPKEFDFEKFKNILIDEVRKGSKRAFFLPTTNFTRKIIERDEKISKEEIENYAQKFPLGTVAEALEKYKTEMEPESGVRNQVL